MSSDWIARHKHRLSDVESAKRLQLHRADIIEAKSPLWFRQLHAAVTRHAADATAEFQATLRVSPMASEFIVETGLVFPAIAIACRLDAPAQCIHVVITRKENASAEKVAETLTAEFDVNGGDALHVAFKSVKYQDPDDLAAHILEYGLLGQDPPVSQRRIDLGMT